MPFWCSGATGWCWPTRRAGAGWTGRRISTLLQCLLALILGGTIAEGRVANPQATLAQLAPRLIPADATEGVGALTMEDLVTLRAGLQGTSGPNYGEWVASGNWVSYAAPASDCAGGRADDLFDRHHPCAGRGHRHRHRQHPAGARPRPPGPGSGDRDRPPTRDPQGFYFGGNEMALTPRAMLRVAVMMRDGGRW